MDIYQPLNTPQLPRITATSSSWEAVSGIVALAMNSAPTSVLRNTGAGISTIGPLKEKVKIGVRENHLQMIFVKNDKSEEIFWDFEKEHLDEVGRNKFYS
jgi:hypothetical protein